MTESESPEDGFFNDLSRPAPNNPTANADGNNDENGIPKPKRIACVLCRKRKLRCDGTRPTCGTCKRLAHDCAYDEVRRKSGPKRGYVKALEARLQQVETLLKTQDAPEALREPQPSTSSTFPASALPPNLVEASNISINGDHGLFNGENISPGTNYNGFPNGENGVAEDQFPWEIISLGLEEPLPPQKDIDELNQIYFNKVHPSINMIHRPRFYAAMNLAPHMRPPVCLRYIMWCFAASLTDKYEPAQEYFYQRARKYAQIDEMRGHGEGTLTIGHCQAWILICTYEFKSMYFPRAWMSAGRAVRLAQMMGLQRVDGVGLDVKQCLPLPKDWTEREERRRTFWGSFCVDRYASIGTGWPMTIDEKDILSNMPTVDEAFDRSKPAASITLEQALQPTGASSLSSFGGVILMACLFGRNLHHLHRPTPEDKDHDLNGGFWKRHRDMENVLLNTSLALPEELRLPTAISNANAIFTNMCLHTSAICLHQAAIFKAEKNRLPANVSNESKIRCVTAAAEIASIMRMISHLDLAAMNPFISFSTYVAARVFVQYIKNRPQDQQMTSSLQFLMQAMHHIKRRNPLTESFLVQLDLDLESAGLLHLRTSTEGYSKQMSMVPAVVDDVSCTPLVQIRENQARAAGGPMHANNTEPLAKFSPRVTDAPDLPNGSSTMSSNSGNNVFRPASTGDKMNAASGPAFCGIVMSVREKPLDNTEMDTSPDGSGGDHATPSTINSHRDSINAFTPPQQPHDGSPQMYNITQNMTTPSLSKTSTNTNPPIPTTPDFFNTENDFAGIGGFYNSHAGENTTPSYGLGNEWDMESGTVNGSAWGQMLDGIGMGWESMGPPHPTYNDPTNPVRGRGRDET